MKKYSSCQLPPSSIFRYAMMTAVNTSIEDLACAEQGGERCWDTSAWPRIMLWVCSSLPGFWTVYHDVCFHGNNMRTILEEEISIFTEFQSIGESVCKWLNVIIWACVVAESWDFCFFAQLPLDEIITKEITSILMLASSGLKCTQCLWNYQWVTTGAKKYEQDDNQRQNRTWDPSVSNQKQTAQNQKNHQDTNHHIVETSSFFLRFPELGSVKCRLSFAVIFILRVCEASG